MVLEKTLESPSDSKEIKPVNPKVTNPKNSLLTPWKESYDQLSTLKSRDIILPTKVHLVKAMVFPAVLYRCESWIIKKAERRRTDAFELWC